MCECRSRIDEALKTQNARLAYGFVGLGMKVSPPLIETEKLIPKGKKPPTVIASYCPFCGEKFKD